MGVPPWFWVVICGFIGWKGIDELTIHDALWKKILAASICGWLAGTVVGANFGPISYATNTAYRSALTIIDTVRRDIQQFGN